MLRSLGETVCRTEEHFLAQLRQRLLERAPLDDTDQMHMDSLRADPNNLHAIKAHAAVLLQSSAPCVDIPEIPDSRRTAPKAMCRGCAEALQHTDAQELVPLPHDLFCEAQHARTLQENAVSDHDDGKLCRPVIVGKAGAMEYAGEALTRRSVALDLYRYALVLKPSDSDCWVALANIHLAFARDSLNLTPGGVGSAGEDGGAGKEAEAAGSGVPSRKMEEEQGRPSIMGGGGHDGDGRQSVAAARAMIDMALRLEPTHCAGLLARGNVKRDVDGDVRGSRQSLLLALSCSEASAPMSLHQGARAQGKGGGSGDDDESRLRLRSKILVSLGLTAEAAGDADEAEVRYRGALEVWGREGSSATMLALLLQARGRLGEAIAVLR